MRVDHWWVQAAARSLLVQSVMTAWAWARVPRLRSDSADLLDERFRGRLYRRSRRRLRGGPRQATSSLRSTLRECARSAPTSAAARSTRRCCRGKPTLRCATPSLGPSSPPSGPLSRRSCSAARSSASRATPDSRPHRWVRKGPLRSGRPARRRDRGRGARGSSDGTWLG